jgi:hypothetical protein
MKDILLFISVILTVVSVIPYSRDILQGKTRPNIVSWITWFLLGLVATVAAVAAGEYKAAIFSSAAVMETSLIVVLGLRYGYVKYARFDVVCQVGVLVGLGLWWIFNSPALAVIAVVTIDLIGALPTVRHSWMRPYEETWISYAVCSFAAILALLALNTYNWVSLPYAIYIVLINALITLILLIRGHTIHPVNRSSGA